MAQERDPDSLLNWMERVIRRRREAPEFGWGSWSVLGTGDAAVLAHRCVWEGRAVVAVHNLSADPREVAVALDTEYDDIEALDLLDDGGTVTEPDRGTLRFKLPGYGYRWFRLHEPGDPRPMP